MSDQEQLPQFHYYLFKVTTRKGVFWVELYRLDAEEAELAIWKTFIELNVPYQRLEPRIYIKGEKEQRMNIDEDGAIMAGELIWRAAGRIAEFEAADIAMKAGFAAEREEYEQRRGD
ncbi:MAG: hypothetical protein IH921_05040 [Gemmatimonadetes bacterium]|nr:hypothetical protein [Gemmatimonadota bacterium]